MKRNGAKEKKKVEAIAKEKGEDEEERGEEREEKGSSCEAPCGAESRSDLFHFEVLRRWLGAHLFKVGAVIFHGRRRGIVETRRTVARLTSTCISGPSSGRLPYFCRANLTSPPSSFFSFPNRLFPTIFTRNSRAPVWNPPFRFCNSPYKLYPPLE